MKAFRPLFTLFLTGLILGSLGYWVISALTDNTEEKIKERLISFGYPKDGYIIAPFGGDVIIRFDTGQAVIMSQNGVIKHRLTVTPIDAYNAAYNYLISHPKIKRALEKGYKIEIKADSLEEYQDGGRYWWRFVVMIRGKGAKYPLFVMVNREDPAVIKIESII